MSINRGMDKGDVVHVYNEILLSHKKKNEIMPFAATDGLRDYHTKSERERQIPYVITYM